MHICWSKIFVYRALFFCKYFTKTSLTFTFLEYFLIFYSEPFSNLVLSLIRRMRKPKIPEHIGQQVKEVILANFEVSEKKLTQ